MLKRILLLAFLLPAGLHAALQLGEFTVRPDPGDYLLPYRPGIDYDETGIRTDGSAASLVPSSAVTFRSLGTPGQTTSFALDGGYSRQARVALGGAVIDIGGNPVVDLGLLPLEFCQSASVYRDNLTPYGFNASSGMIDFRLPDPRAALSSVGLWGGSFGLIGGRVTGAFHTPGANLLAGISYSRARNDYPVTAEDGSTNTAGNLDYYRYSAILKLTTQAVSVQLTHTGKRGGAGTYYAGSGRQADDMTLASLALRSEAANWEASYVRWSNRYSNQTYGIDDRHVNHTLTLSGGSSLYGPAAVTNGIARQARLSLKLTSRTYAALSTQYGNPWDEQVALSLDGVLPAGPFDIGAAAALLYSASGGFQAMPSLTVTAYPGKSVRLFATVSRQANLPSFNDLYWQFDGFSRGNPGLLPETGWRAKTGVMLFSLPFYGSVTASYVTMDNLILWAPADGGIWTPNNVGKTTALVGEASLHYERFAAGLRFRASLGFSYDRAVNADPASEYFGLRIPYTPLYKTSASVSAGKPDVWEVGVSFRQVSERFTTELNTVWLEPYYLLDATAKWRFLYVAAANLLDARYEESQGYPMPGRNFRAGIDWQF